MHQNEYKHAYKICSSGSSNTLWYFCTQEHHMPEIKWANTQPTEALPLNLELGICQVK